MKGIEEFNSQEFTGTPPKTEGSLGKKHLSVCSKFHKQKVGCSKLEMDLPIVSNG